MSYTYEELLKMGAKPVQNVQSVQQADEVPNNNSIEIITIIGGIIIALAIIFIVLPYLIGISVAMFKKARDKFHKPSQG